MVKAGKESKGFSPKIDEETEAPEKLDESLIERLALLLQAVYRGWKVRKALREQLMAGSLGRKGVRPLNIFPTLFPVLSSPPRTKQTFKEFLDGPWAAAKRNAERRGIGQSDFFPRSHAFRSITLPHHT